MASLTDSNTFFKDYSTHARPADNPNVRGGNDHRLFNKNERWEVRFTINHFIEAFNVDNLESAHYAEKIIRHELPAGRHTHKEVYDWLARNWNNYLKQY